MLTPPALAAQRVLDLQADAATGRLARLAACCRPGALRAAASSAVAAARAFARRGQLSVAQACCPWPV